MMQIAPPDNAVTGLPKRQRPKGNPTRKINEYPDVPDVERAIADEVRAACREWGLPMIAHDAERLTFVQARWLMTHEHTAGDRLFLDALYDEERRMLTVLVGDPGSMLPVGEDFYVWCERLRPGRQITAWQQSGAERRLQFSLQVRHPWRVRIKWNREALEGQQPEHSFEGRTSEEDARTTVEAYRRLEGVAGIHWQGPEDPDDEWHECIASTACE